MENDFSYINSESDLDRATQTVNDRLTSTRQQLKENSQELPQALKQAAIRKSLPFIAGAAGVVIGTLLIKKLMQGSHRTPAIISKSPASSVVKSSATKSAALQLLLPIATVLVKKWLANRKAARNEVDTQIS